MFFVLRGGGRKEEKEEIVGNKMPTELKKILTCTQDRVLQIPFLLASPSLPPTSPSSSKTFFFLLKQNYSSKIYDQLKSMKNP